MSKRLTKDLVKGYTPETGIPASQYLRISASQLPVNVKGGPLAGNHLPSPSPTEKKGAIRASKTAAQGVLITMTSLPPTIAVIVKKRSGILHALNALAADDDGVEQALAAAKRCGAATGPLCANAQPLATATTRLSASDPSIAPI